MTRHRKTQLVIVAEAALERPLVQLARELGAQAWSVADVRGGAVEGEREGRWEADRTIELKLVCEDAVADTIATRVMARFAANYALSLTFAEVWVLRPERY